MERISIDEMCKRFVFKFFDFYILCVYIKIFVEFRISDIVWCNIYFDVSKDFFCDCYDLYNFFFCFYYSIFVFSCVYIVYIVLCFLGEVCDYLSFDVERKSYCCLVFC